MAPRRMASLAPLLLLAWLCGPAAAQPRGLGNRTRTIPLTSAAGCRSAAAPKGNVLTGGLGSRCVIEGVVQPNEM
jgi:hypothetical protein